MHAKSTEEECLHSRAFLLHPQAQLIFDPEGRIQTANRAARRAFGEALSPKSGEAGEPAATLADIFEVAPGNASLPGADTPLEGELELGAHLRISDGEAAAPGKLRLIPFDQGMQQGGGRGLAVWQSAAELGTPDAVRTEHARYRSLFQQTHDAVFILDLQGRHLEVNQRAADMLGYSHEEIRGLSLKDVSAETDRSEDVRSRLLAGETVPPYERTFYRKDGSEIHVEINAEVVFDAAGEPLHIQSIVRDISERKRDEAVIRRLLEEKELLLREVHHRIRNNLGSLISMVQLEAEDTDDPAMRSGMETVGRRIYSVLLVYESLFVSDEFRMIELRDYLRELVARLRDSYGSSPRVTFETDLQPLGVTARNAFPIGIIVNELVTNAVKYAFPARREGRILVSFRLDPTGREYRLVVHDDGIGYDETHQGAPGESGSGGFGRVMLESMVSNIGAEMTREHGSGTLVSIRGSATALQH